jgi:CheY-like chemotaxis protein
MRDDAIPEPLRVLVVDDCPDMTESLAVLLRCWGHEPAAAHDGQEALALAAAIRPDVVLLDIGLPGMDGYQVARLLRDKVGLRDAFLASLTGYCRPEDSRRSREAGCDRHWTKPLAPEVLEQALAARKKWLQESRSSSQAKAGPSREPPAPGMMTFGRTASAPGVAERAEGRLRRNAYLALKNITCECRDGVLTLRGSLPTWYLKQVAQATVAGVEGVGRVENRIEVVGSR